MGATVTACFEPETRVAFYRMLQALVLNNTLRFEESQIVYEFEGFAQLQGQAEKDGTVLLLISQIKNELFVLRTKKSLRSSTFDNSALLQKYEKARERLLDQQLGARENNEEEQQLEKITKKVKHEDSETFVVPQQEHAARSRKQSLVSQSNEPLHQRKKYSIEILDQEVAQSFA